jgi:hypothetical protein
MVSFVRRIDPFGNLTLNGSTLLQVHVITSSCLNIQRNRVGLSGLAKWPSDVLFLRIYSTYADDGMISSSPFLDRITKHDRTQ